MLSIGPYANSSQVILAPMAGITDKPFRDFCYRLGGFWTVSEMVTSNQKLWGSNKSRYRLNHADESGLSWVQLAGSEPDQIAQAAKVNVELGAHIIDINMGCPIDLICNKGAGAMLLEKPKRMEELVRSSNLICSVPLTFKTRMGYRDTSRVAHTFVPRIKEWGASALTLHGRTRAQRYSREADWEYIRKVADASSVPIIGNGDIYTYHDYVENVVKNQDSIATCMIARGALVKPWIFTEIKEQRN